MALLRETARDMMTREQIKSAQRTLRARIAEAINQSLDSQLSLAEQATAVEAELLVQGFDARVLAPELLDRRLPLAV